MSFPVIDLHCDLLHYLVHTPNATPYRTEDIGVALPYLRAGGVKQQVMAIYVPTKAGSVVLAERQVEQFQQLVQGPDFYALTSPVSASKLVAATQVGITAAIENASGLAEEAEPLAKAFERLDAYEKACGRLFYIGLTHHGENRFGGGNNTANVGLKPDGEQLLEYLNNRQIAIDLAHASDQLAYDILTYIDRRALQIPVIASHSNFRFLENHVRNLPDELVMEVVRRGGLIGINWLRAYIHPTDPQVLLDHIVYGLTAGKAQQQLAFGADFFYRQAITAPERQPLFFPEHEDAGKYPEILQALADQGVTNEQLAGLSHENVLAFLQRTWLPK